MPRSVYGVAGVDPVLVPLGVGAGLDEELHLHLLELARAEDPVLRRDLVAEALADLADAERRLLARGAEDVREVDEDALRGLGAEVVHALLVVDGAEEGLEEAREVLRLGPGSGLAGVRVLDVGESVDGRVAVLRLVRLEEVVGAIALVGVQRLDERVAEDLDVAGRLPHAAGQDHRGVEAHDVVAAVDHGLPPLALDVLLQRHAERPVVPRGARAAVDLTRLEDEPAPLGEVDDRVETRGGCHVCS